MHNKTLALISKLMHKAVGKGVPFTAPDNIISNFDIPYNTRDGKTLYMNVFVPKVEEGTELPLIVDVHGGGLISGSKETDLAISQIMASKGYIVCSLEYRLVPAVNIYEQVADICAGMEFVGKYMLNYDVDYTRIFLMAESAGAYLATYAAAMKYSRVLQEAIGYKEHKMKFRAMAMLSGMFYTKKHDLVGMMANSFYGKDERARKIAPYTNPEHPQVIYNLPPTLLITSKHDFIGKYSYEFSRALNENGIENKLVDYGKAKYLKHVFAVTHPEFDESKKVMVEIDNWFKNHSKLDT